MVWDLIPHEFVYWIAIGGFFYTTGAIIYGVKKPDPYPEVFGFHEIWHLFVMGGAFSHYWAIYKYLPDFNLPT
jgi:hemolysin III